MRGLFASLFTGILFFLLLSGCQPARRIPSGRYLLNRVEIHVAGGEVKQSELRPHLKQAPNKRVLGGRFHLWLYNQSNLQKETRFQRGLRSVGEAPVLYDEELTQKSIAQFLRYLQTKGYYSAMVIDSVGFRPRRAVVRYEVSPGRAHYIGSIKRTIADTALRRAVLRDTLRSLLHSGMAFDHTLLGNERDRIEKLLRNQEIGRASCRERV